MMNPEGSQISWAASSTMRSAAGSICTIVWDIIKRVGVSLKNKVMTSSSHNMNHVAVGDDMPSVSSQCGVPDGWTDPQKMKQVMNAPLPVTPSGDAAPKAKIQPPAARPVKSLAKMREEAAKRGVPPYLGH